MKNTTIYILIIILVAIVAGAYIYLRDSANEVREYITNNEMLKNDNGTEIVTESNVQYFEDAKGYFVRPKENPATGEYPGVVMIHENRGLRSEIKSTAEQLAREGYVVLAVDLFNGQVVETQDDARKITGSFDQTRGVENMKAAVKYLKDKGVNKIASLGWCFGGKQSIELAISGEKLDATIVYYGGGMATTTERLEPIKWPVLGIFGDKDQAIPVSTVEVFRSSLNELDIENEIYIYPGVGHAFANPSGMNYAPKETQDAWNKTLAFLNKHLK